MPLTAFQTRIARLLAENRSPDSYLAGGAALHFTPNTLRFSNDLDFFHDSEQRVAEAFRDDSQRLIGQGMSLTIEMKQPGYIRATVNSELDSTKIEWAHDSAWRFMPVIRHPEAGYQLHPVDIAVNKALALAGRDEARDFLDVMYIDRAVLSLGALIWAACGKDPGFTPLSLLELLKRRGRYQQEDFSRLHLTRPVELTELKRQWLGALDYAAEFVHSRPPSEIGCLYYSTTQRTFLSPESSSELPKEEIQPHYGSPGGILPRFYQGDVLAEAIQNFRL